MTDTPTEPIIGIDLGTTNSLVAWCNEAGPRVLHLPDASPMIPSVVRYSEDGTAVDAVGTEARQHAVEFPDRTIASIKRLLGRSVDDVQDDIAFLGYTVVRGEHDTARVQVGDTVISPQEVSAAVLREVRRVAEAALEQPVKKAVVTVPAYFDDTQRQATRDAGRIAGLDVVRIVNEPTAAALAYGLGLAPGSGESAVGSRGEPKKSADCSISLNTKFNPDACTSEGEQPEAGDAPNSRRPTPDSPQSSQTIAVFDLGGGTFDVSILRLEQTDTGSVDQVLSTDGDTHLGGDDVDRMLVELIQKEIIEQFFPDRQGESAQDLFPGATRQAFRRFAEQTKIQLSNDDHAQVQVDLGDGRTYERTITRDELEQMIAPWVQRALDKCGAALKAAKLKPDDIDRVIMVGGSTRIPMVRRQVGELFGQRPYTALDPDQVVALGASVQAAVLAGIKRDTLLLDVIPLSLGIETMGGAVAKLITSNSTIPARATEMFSTYAEGQTNVKIHVLQGERELVQDCRSLGTFELKGIPPMPAGLPKIEVTFLIDANGVLSVTAIEQRSEKAASIQIVPNHGLTRDEVDRIESEAFAHAKDDMTAHRIIDLKNQARLDLRQIDRQLEKVGSEIDDDYRDEVLGKAQAVRGFVEQDQPDAEAFHAALDAMDQSTVRLAEVAIAQTLREDSASNG